MTIELAAVAVLVYVGWTLERIAQELQAIETEMSTARWERGKRESLRLEELKRQGR